jgi:hypothetical protein
MIGETLCFGSELDGMPPTEPSFSSLNDAIRGGSPTHLSIVDQFHYLLGFKQLVSTDELSVAPEGHDESSPGGGSVVKEYVGIAVWQLTWHVSNAVRHEPLPCCRAIFPMMVSTGWQEKRTGRVLLRDNYLNVMTDDGPSSAIVDQFSNLVCSSQTESGWPVGLALGGWRANSPRAAPHFFPTIP